MNGTHNSGSEEVFNVTNQISTERPQVIRKDRNAPAKPLSPYALFFKETQASIKSEQPEATFASVSEIVDAMWQALGQVQKQKYEEQSVRDRERFEQEMIAYRAGSVEETKTVVPPVKYTPLPTPTGGLKCIRLGCEHPSVRNLEWEDEYCSNQYVVLHCEYVFREWVREQASKA
ncbi:TOX high mobility group box family member 4-A [Eurytemora carolleeae]|uniref:TOX high mobility group box family member 4-A n=1 Tax=Eurytemora carolleeae TaxID=1294199 RepID=UPI000C765C79|nr:TOX high mobility group box family member 4-A [Eurytemora carolleeae]|eukprot:XP_023347627.1 TOX high mobility group box family member 4-A-like [Eurytemora affinis]